MAFDGCCGKMAARRKRPAPLKLPDNPKPAGGVNLVYVGAGLAEIRGAFSGLTYHLADHRRHFSAHPADVSAILRSRDFILPP